MTADSVPAPMVQVPAALVDALDEWDVRYPAKWAFGASANYEMGVRDERRRLREIIVMGRNTFAVDAATPAASVPAADILALADKWYPGTPGPRRMTSWARLAYEDCARELRALVDERQPQRCEHGILRRLDCFECNEVAAAEQADKGEAAWPESIMRLHADLAPAARVPVNDEAEAEMAWREWIHECPHLCNTDRCSFLAGFRAARQGGNSDE